MVGVTCDQCTPVEDKGHSDDPVPLLMIGGKVKADGSARFTEKEAVKGSIGILDRGSLLLGRLKQAEA